MLPATRPFKSHLTGSYSMYRDRSEDPQPPGDRVPQKPMIRRDHTGHTSMVMESDSAPDPRMKVDLNTMFVLSEISAQSSPRRQKP